MDWILKEKYAPGEATVLGNRFFTGNGYMGVRGVIDEAGEQELAAINIAGLYDGIKGKWRETVNAPNFFYAYLSVDDELLKADDAHEHATEIALNLKTGEFTRRSIFTTVRGTVTFESTRFVSMKDCNLGIQTFKISADFHADIKLTAGIDCNVWDINGPHLKEFTLSDKPYLNAHAVTQEKGIAINASAYMSADFPCQERIISEDGKLLYEFNFITDTGKTYEFRKLVGVNTNKSEGPLDQYVSDDLSACCEDISRKHRAEWESIWDLCAVEIVGDEEAEFALNYSIYQQYSIAPVEGSGLSIPARGLSGQTYKGAVFWDTEIFMMDLFINTKPKTARELIMYRVNGLEGALEKARRYGYEGAFYAWESQENGFDACSDYNVTDVFTGRPMRTYFKDKQVHISAAIVYAIQAYIAATGDESVLRDGAARTVIECARFYLSLLWQRPHSEVFEIRDVIGPDEYHERVNNNTYTNGMALFTLKYAFELVSSSLKEGAENVITFLSCDEKRLLADRLSEAVDKLYIPKPDKESGVIPQFDGYLQLEDVRPAAVKARLLNPKEYWGGAYGVAAETQVIKQADVIAYMALMPELYSAELQLINWNYYEVRSEHGSSLSSCMYGLVACECGLKDRAYDMFMKSAKADLLPSEKEWAGLIYIGGVHPAAHGGAYMLALRGFAGMKRDSRGLHFDARLPKHWESMCFKVIDRDKKFRVKIEQSKVTLEEIR